MLTIKLRRIGKKHQSSFRIIVDEKRHKLNGNRVEDLGWYNPNNNKHQINTERVNYWLKNGAQATDTIHNLFVAAGILQEKKIAVHKKPKNKKENPSAAPTSVSEPKPAA